MTASLSPFTEEEAAKVRAFGFDIEPTVNEKLDLAGIRASGAFRNLGSILMHEPESKRSHDWFKEASDAR